MKLDLLKNITEKIKNDDNVKEFMQDLSESLENKNKQNPKLKEAKRIANFEFHIMPDLDENIIDVKYKIIDEDNK